MGYQQQAKLSDWVPLIVKRADGEPYQVKLKPVLDAGFYMDLTDRSEEQIRKDGIAIQLLEVIEDWTLDDEAGNKVPITEQTVRMISGPDFNRIMRIVKEVNAEPSADEEMAFLSTWRTGSRDGELIPLRVLGESRSDASSGDTWG